MQFAPDGAVPTPLKVRTVNNNNDPDWVSNGKQTVRPVRGELASFTKLVLGCIESKFCK